MNNLSTFVEVVRAGSLAAAARKLGVPKSTVGRRLARLEEEIGVQLVRSDGRRARLTDDARELYDTVASSLDTIDQALRWFGAASTTLQGVVRISAPLDLGRMEIAPSLAEFGRTYPGITVDLSLSDRLVDLVQEGFDLAIRAGVVRAELGTPSLISRQVCPSILRLAAHPSRAAAIDSVEQLRREPFVLFRPQAQPQRLILFDERAPTAPITLDVTGTVVVHDYSALAEFVAQDRGVGLLPDFHLAHARVTGRLAPVLPLLSLRSGSLLLVYPSRKLPRRVRVLLEFLTASLTDRHAVALPVRPR
ncbi:MAG: LysR substrate-binding domain-containing protein [Nannocystaceae bacterium]